MIQGRAFHLNPLQLGTIGTESQDKSCSASGSIDLEQTPVAVLHTVHSNPRLHQSSTSVGSQSLTQAQCDIRVFLAECRASGSQKKCGEFVRLSLSQNFSASPGPRTQ